MDHVRQRIERRIREMGTDMATISKQVGRNHAYLQQFIRRGVPAELPEQVRLSLAKALSLNPDELRLTPPSISRDGFAQGSEVQLARDVPMPAELMARAEEGVPIYGVGEAGADGSFPINMHQGPIAYLPRAPGIENATNVFAAYVVGDSMVPWRKPGSAVIVQPGKPILKDCHVLVALEAGPGEPPLAFVKQFVKQDDDEILLRQYNPPREIAVSRSRLKGLWRVLEWEEVLGI